MKLDSLSNLKFALSAFAILNLLLLTTGYTSAETLKVADGRGPAARSVTTIFTFMASGLCSAATDQCVEIGGSGTLRFNDEIKARGHFIKYNGETQTSTTASYSWTATKLMNANEIRIHFKAKTGLGNIDIAITEGKGPNSGLVCIWGTLNGITGQNETLCTNKVRVYID
jgi:hypothetical protein